jgi:hypothetical protein
MKNRFDASPESLAFERSGKFGGLHEVRESEIARRAEVIYRAINDEHVRDAFGIQRSQQIAADEACSAG